MAGKGYGQWVILQVRNALLEPQPQTHRIRSSGVEPAICVVTRRPDDCNACSRLRMKALKLLYTENIWTISSHRKKHRLNLSRCSPKYSCQSPPPREFPVWKKADSQSAEVRVQWPVSMERPGVSAPAFPWRPSTSLSLRRSSSLSVVTEPRLRAHAHIHHAFPSIVSSPTGPGKRGEEVSFQQDLLIRAPVKWVRCRCP